MIDNKQVIAATSFTDDAIDALVATAKAKAAGWKQVYPLNQDSLPTKFKDDAYYKFKEAGIEVMNYKPSNEKEKKETVSITETPAQDNTNTTPTPLQTRPSPLTDS